MRIIEPSDEKIEPLDIIIIGGGPTGLACAIEAQRAGFNYLTLEKGCVVNSLYNYPTQLVFFTTPELLEIGDLPFVCEREKPVRIEALKYYRRVVRHYRLRVNQYEKVTQVSGSDGAFMVETESALTGEKRSYRSRKIIVAIGYYDYSNALDIPGEDLPKVSHYYKDAHPFYDRDVAVIGGANSAAIAALDLHRRRARDDDPSRSSTSPLDQILDIARHRKPHHQRRGQSASPDHRHGDQTFHNSHPQFGHWRRPGTA